MFASSVYSTELSNESLEARWSAAVGEFRQMNVSRKFPFDDCFELASTVHDVPKPLLLAVARGEARSPEGTVRSLPGRALRRSLFRFSGSAFDAEAP